MKHEFYTQGSSQYRKEFLAALTIVAGCFWLNTACAKEVYTWTDKDGVSHFSDVPPESGDSQQLTVEDAYSPGPSSYAVEESSETVSSEGSSEPAAESQQSRAQQVRKQLAEDRKKRDEEQAENAALCAKNRQLVAQLEPARRVYYTDEAGEQARMDDEQRVGMVEEAKDFIAKNCK